MFTITKSIDGDVTTKEVAIVGRKLSLLEIRKKLLHQHQKYMRLLTDQKIRELTREKILELMSLAHYESRPDATIDDLRLQRSRTLAVWHDHSTVLQQGYIPFAIWVVYDTGLYLIRNEYVANGGQVDNLQEEIEQPKIHSTKHIRSIRPVSINKRPTGMPPRATTTDYSPKWRSHLRQGQVLCWRQTSSTI